MYNYGQTPTNVVQFKMKEHPAKKYKEEIFKYNLVTDQFANLKVYRPVNKKKNQQENNKATVLSQIQQGRLPLIQRKAIIKAQFVNEGLIAAARVDGKMRFYMWVNQANDLNPLTPFTCGKEKKKLYEYALSPVLLQNDFTLTTLNKPMLILNRGKIVISGGHWDGQISVSYTQELHQDRNQNTSLANQFTRGHGQANTTTPGNQCISALIQGHSTTCTVIASTIDDPNRIISKNQQTSSQASIQNDACTVITGSKSGDVIVWKFMPDQNLAGSNIFSKQKHFYDHDDQVSSVFIHQDMQYFATSSFDGTCNLYNLWKLEIMRCFKHPSSSPLSTVILSNQPLVSLAMFSPVDKVWVSFSINGQNLNELEKDPEVLTKNYSEESSHIVAPKVIQNAYFMERLIYGTERGYIVIRELPFMAPLKRINISTNNLIQPVLTFIVSKDRRFLLVGCGEGGLTVITEPFSTSQQALKQQTKSQNQSIAGSSQQSSMQNHNTSSQISQGGQSSNQGKQQIGNSGSIQVSQISQISQATSRNDMQNASFVSSNATGHGTTHSNSYQKLSGVKNANQAQQSAQISNNMNSSSGTDASLSISGGNPNAVINRPDQQNVNISLRQSIVSKKLGSKITAQQKTQQQVYDNHHYGGVQVGAQSMAILRSSDKKSPNGSNGSRNNSQAQGSNTSKQAFQSIPATSAGKIRINTSLSSAQRQNSTGKQRGQDGSKNTNVIIGSNVAKVGVINIQMMSNSTTGKPLSNAQIIGMAPHSSNYSQTLKTQSQNQSMANPYDERQQLKPGKLNQGSSNPRSSVLTIQNAFQGIQQTMKSMGTKKPSIETNEDTPDR